MGTNQHPYYGSGQQFFDISASPIDLEQTIERQGQLVRLIQTRKCACIKNGRAQLDCKLCSGKGIRLGFQEECFVSEEDTPHYEQTITPFWKPITKVEKVMKWIEPIQGGNTFYTVDSFTDNTITILPDQYGNYPKRYERLLTSYWYSALNKVINENSLHDGTEIIHTTGTEISTKGKTSDPFNVHGSIQKVRRVYNLTQNITYTVKSFGKHTITLDANQTFPLTTDVIQVDYDFFPAITIGLGKIDIKNAMSKWGEDLKQGDIESVIAANWMVKRGNIITLLTSFIPESAIITRGAGLIDELPQFDVADITGQIEDVDGVLYTNGIDFTLLEYNQLKWIGTTPAQGKNYSIVYRYHPSYMVYQKDISAMSAEDKLFPINWLLRIFNKFTIDSFNGVL